MITTIEQSADIAALCEAAVRGLAPMFDQERRLFCQRRNLTSHGLVNEGTSHRYTVITLLGLLEAKAVSQACVSDLDAIVGGLIGDLNWVEGVGDLGLLWWLCSRSSGNHLKALRAKMDVNQVLPKAADAKQGKTTELAWLLTGLSEAALAIPDYRSEFRSTALHVLAMLLGNQGPSGLFGHLAKGQSVPAALRSHVGCFADQVYPIYGLTQFAAAFEFESALIAAEKCGSKICELQGELGQWWWHYDARLGRVFGKYPVFSVHQDGMAPMALLPLEKATGQSFSKYVYKGLDWIYGNNELQMDMRHEDIIWRSIYDGDRYARYLSSGLSLLGLRHSRDMKGKLQVKYECRPYHLGWILYAFAAQARPRDLR